MKSTAPIAFRWLLVTAGLAAADIIFSPDTEDGDRYSLPKDFLMGAGTSAYQTEGAWNLNGKGESVLDHYFNPERLPQNERIGNIAADSYHHIDDDIEMIRRLKLQMYRFSLSWTRLLPDGDAKNPNPDGIRFYNEIIDKLLKINVVPFVNLYHFDHPNVFEESFHGWQSHDIIQPFLAFADFAFRTFGDRVKYWTTLNEPNMNCLLASSGLLGPPAVSTDTPAGAFYTCMRNQLLAHASAYRMYQTKYAATQGGTVGLTFYSDINRPNSTSFADVEAAERANAFGIGLCASPVIFGDFPEIVINHIEQKSKAQNRASWLPKFSDAEKELLRNSTDFLGINIYHGYEVAARVANSPTQKGSKNPKIFELPDESDVIRIQAPTAGGTGPFGNAFTLSTPWSMRDSLLYTWSNFKVPIFITENGLQDSPEDGIHDEKRAMYHSAYMRTMVETMKDNGVNVLGMAVWSLIDGLEWSRTNKSRFGLVHIDYSTPQRTRTLKESSAFFIKLAEERVVPLVLPSAAAPDAVVSGTSTSRSAWFPHLLIACAMWTSF